MSFEAQLQLAFVAEGMRFCVLGSGSSGNCLVVENGDSRVLLDAGFSCRELERRLDTVGVSSRNFDAIILTHEHGDHSRGAARFSRRNGVPIYATGGTLSALRLPPTLPTPRTIEAGRRVKVGAFSVEPFPIPHDAREPVGLVIECDGLRLGVASDLGMRSKGAWNRLRNLDALVLEANHDQEMLETGPYPWPLKRRIASDRGHLSNCQAAEALEHVLSDRLKWVVLYHLSETNNMPNLARGAVARVLAKAVGQAEICVAEQSTPSPWLSLGEAALA